MAVQPFIIAGLAVGAAAAAYGAYRYYRYRKRENIINQIRNEHAALAPFINNYTENNGGIGLTSHAHTLNGSQPRHNRLYDVYINLQDPVGSGQTSAALVESVRSHEMTHVSADQSYSANATPGISQNIFHTTGIQQTIPIYSSYPIYDRADRLLTAIRRDGALTAIQKKHLKNRIKENSIKYNEWDSTINELLVYSQQEGIRSNSETSKLLVKYAKENLLHRQGRIIDLPRLIPSEGDYYHTKEMWKKF